MSLTNFSMAGVLKASITVSQPICKPMGTMPVCEPFRMRTFLSRNCLIDGMKMTCRPALSSGSSFITSL